MDERILGSVMAGGIIFGSLMGIVHKNLAYGSLTGGMSLLIFWYFIYPLFVNSSGGEHGSK